ncbi:MAG: tRNA pseudouridine(38-40) synthase TruA [Acetobacteraceae bacterium]|nr:tRNA pseudouridine(38-40) synthase TruA [Acetobacteraceae bacterium]
MTRWALLLEYDGTGFVGWQSQAGGGALQDHLEAAAGKLVGNRVTSVVAGRTDAGVHASGQVAAMDLPERFDARTVREAINHHLKPLPFVVLQAAAVGSEWSPRFDAIGRRYRYVILNRRARPGLDRHVWHVPARLDEGAMAAAAGHLLGRHDFTSFRAAACQAKSPWRTLDVLRVAREGERVVIDVEARSFLHHQVRNMVGTLKLVGEGRWAAERVAAALAARDRAAAGPTAPPGGLTLTGVVYPADPFSPAGPDRSPAPPSPH